MTRIRGKKVAFKKYLEMGLKRGAWGDSPESDFAGDALRDRDFRDFEEWEIDDLASHIRLKGGCPEAVTAARNLFRKWRAS